MIRSLAALVVLDAQPDDRRAQDVAGVDERGMDAGRDLDLLAVFDRLERARATPRRPWPCRAARRGRSGGRRLARSPPAVGGLRGCARPGPPWSAGRAARRVTVGRARAPVSSSARRRALSAASPAAQVDGAPGTGRPPSCRRRRPRPGGASPSAPRAWRTPRGACPSRAGRARRARSCRAVAWIAAAIAVLDEQRQQPAMVEMGVGQQHGVERRRVVCERDPVADRLVRAALEHPAIDEDPGAARVEQVLRAGDGRRATEEVEVHRGVCQSGR